MAIDTRNKYPYAIHLMRYQVSRISGWYELKVNMKGGVKMKKMKNGIWRINDAK